jgi:SAM-dependent methyltransferase
MGLAETTSSYWDGVFEGWEVSTAHRLWRAHSDTVNSRLLARWLPVGSRNLLKTDLFDEAVGDGLAPELFRRAREVVGIDISPLVVAAAQARYPQLAAHVVSVLDLPFPARHFDAVVSNSTLDHFDSLATLDAAVAELARVIRPQGRLIITLDNRNNPVVNIRTSTAARLLRRLGAVPYFVGPTYGRRGLSKSLRASGFEVRETTAIMHCPPQLAARLATLQGGGFIAREGVERHLGRVLRIEAMERWPTRMLTGHFVAALAIRR